MHQAVPKQLHHVLIQNIAGKFEQQYQFQMLEDNKSCINLCAPTTIPAEDAKFVNERIKQDYSIRLLVDGLPAAEVKVDTRTQEHFYDIGRSECRYRVNLC